MSVGVSVGVTIPAPVDIVVTPGCGSTRAVACGVCAAEFLLVLCCLGCVKGVVLSTGGAMASVPFVPDGCNWKRKGIMTTARMSREADATNIRRCFKRNGSLDRDTYWACCPLGLSASLRSVTSMDGLEASCVASNGVTIFKARVGRSVAVL